ncbi:dymeclin-like isoform X1 [Chenopodium quinoa]|uniref:dymeclin-like isoform X1 n=1 Tax=Chenopodium quinoa TaxID=63459 RepID=UPI000B7756B6|nr:dymeclin-like isoform X1 [Chenopodium quinoa]
MGSVPSTPRNASVVPQDTVEYVIATFVGEKSFPLTSEFWHKLLELPLQFHWPPDRVRQACDSLAQNNYYTRHLAKLLIHLSYCLQDCISCPGAPSITFTKALNAAYLSSVFLTHTIENSKTGNFEELHLSLVDHEVPSGLPKDQSVENIIICSVLSFIGTVEASPRTYQLHCELLNFMMAAMSTQLLSGPSSGPKDFHPFLDAIMSQEASLVASVVSKLLVNYISQSLSGFSGASYSTFEGSQSGVLQKVGSAAANFVLFPLNLTVGSNNEASKSLLAQSSLHILLILVHFRSAVADDFIIGKNDGNGASDALHKEKTYFCENPFCKALENARDVEFDRLDVEGNAHSGPLARVPFASLYDTLGMCLADEAAILLLYSLVHGNADFLEYVLVRTDLDTLLMPILEILYNAPQRTSNQIYMLLIILLILSQDSTFNASVHKLMLPNVPWYKERRLNYTSIGSLMVIILIRTVKYNLCRLQDVYLHTNCLAALTNMAPHVHRLDAYASQRLVSLFHMLSRKYTKLAELQNDKMQINKVNSTEGDNMLEDVSMELHIYTDFLRIVLEIINAILTYALPRNPEVVYAVMHRQEIFEPFRNHPRFNELLENIFTVLDFFNTRLDAQELDGEWSVEKVLQVITNNCKSWHGEGMKRFTQLRFTYEQESHPEEFFIPYVWQLAVAKCGFAFSPSKINLFLVDLSRETAYRGEGDHKNHDGELSAQEVELDP